MLRCRKGFNAIFDASVCILLIVLCMPLILDHVPDEDDGIMAGEVMDVIVGTRIRASDVTGLEDGTIYGMYDLLAYSSYSDDPGPMDYVGTYLESVLSGQHFFFSAEYMGKTVSIGEQTGETKSSSERQCIVSFGGTVTMILYIYH